jgi:CRISPR/Cas system-associated endonuclease Cas1
MWRGESVQLVINTFGANLRKQGDQFLVQAGDDKLAVSAHKVQSILLATAAHLSTDAVAVAVAHNIDLVFLHRHGDPFARIAHRAPLAFKAIMTLPQPTAFSALLKGCDGECPCCRRRFADAS